MQKRFGATFIQADEFCFCWSNLAFRSTIERHLSGAKHWSSDCQVSFWKEIYENQPKREHGRSLFWCYFVFFSSCFMKLYTGPDHWFSFDFWVPFSLREESDLFLFCFQFVVNISYFDLEDILLSIFNLNKDGYKTSFLDGLWPINHPKVLFVM